MLSLLYRSLKYNLSAHFANLPNLIAGSVGMVINNFIFLTGMWGMLFAGKPQNHDLLFYYVSMNALIMTSWGAINFFFGGWIDLGELIVSGQFESKLSTPRHPLLLVATHALHPSALGDFVMGLVGIGVLFRYGPEGMALRTMLACAIAIPALFALFVFSGSLAFFVARGNVLAMLTREMTISLSSYPMGKIFSNGVGRIFLLLSPAAAVSVLPLDWIESAGLKVLLLSLFGLAVFLTVAMGTYSRGVKRFQAMNVIGAQS